MSNVTNADAVVTEQKLTEFYNDIKPFLGCTAYLTSEGNAEYYSTDEKVIGRWIDGKPLYQKTINCGTLPNATNKTINHGISNIDMIVDMNGIANKTDGTKECRYLPTVNLYKLDYGVYLEANATEIFIDVGSVDRRDYDAHVTLKYTKTTDSASTTIQEDPNEYSTDEKIIGKWVDGKPIYQKVYNNIAISPSANELDVASLNIDSIISMSGKYVYNNDYVYNFSHVDPNGGFTYACDLFFRKSTNKITFLIGSAINNGNVNNLIIQYTKTTD